MVQNYIIKNWKVLFKIQWMGFGIFSVLSFFYYWDKAAHVYFNRSLEIINFQSIFSLLMTWLFVSFTVLILIYPLPFLVQAYFIRHQKGSGRRLFFLFILYLSAIASLFSLYIIHSSHSIKATVHSL